MYLWLNLRCKNAVFLLSAWALLAKCEKYNQESGKRYCPDFFLNSFYAPANVPYTIA